MPILTVTPQAMPVPAQSNQPIFVQNNGTAIIYCSTTQDVSPTNNHGIVGPGGSISWPSNQPLYVCTDANLVAPIQYLNNGGGINSGSTYSQSSNAPQLIGTTTFPVANTPGAVQYIPPLNTKMYQVSAFASLIIQMKVITNPKALISATDASSWIAGAFVFYSQPNNTDGRWILDTFQPQWLYGTTFQGTNRVQLPVRGSYFEISDPNLNSSCLLLSGTKAPATLVISVYGSSEVIDQPQYQHETDGLWGRLFSSGIYNSGPQTGPINVQQYIGSTNKPATINVTNDGGAGGRVAVNFFEYGASIGGLGQSSSATTGQTGQLALTLPMRPVLVQTIASTGNAVETVITQ